MSFYMYCTSLLVAAVVLFALWRRRNSQRKNWEKLEWSKVGEVSHLWLYPIKSCRGVPLTTAEALHNGLKEKGFCDRSLMISTESGTMVTGRQIGKTVIITPVIEERGVLQLEMEGMEPLRLDLQQVEEENIIRNSKVWGQTVVGFDCGKEASKWISQALKEEESGLFLLYSSSLSVQRFTKPSSIYPLLKIDDVGKYADLCAFLLMTDGSLEDLNSKLEDPVTFQWFRPNIVLKGVPAFEEDKWKYIKINDAIFRNCKPCDRCVFTTVDPDIGERRPQNEPLATLKKFRCSESIGIASKSKVDPMFGVNLGLECPGSISVGDAVYASYQM
ncbi:mitochondrial amidoxime reducing component 2-like isoform X2 [Oratosquilla oratoria]